MNQNNYVVLSHIKNHIHLEKQTPDVHIVLVPCSASPLQEHTALLHMLILLISGFPCKAVTTW